MNRGRLDDKSRVTVPREIRRRLHLKPGDEIDHEVHNGYAVVRKASPSGLDLLQEFCGEDWRGYAEVVQRDRDEWDR